MDVTEIGLSSENLKVMTGFPEWTGVQYIYKEEEVAFAGDVSGRVLVLECPWATQEMAQTVLERLRGRMYQPYEAENAFLDPAAELGDTVNAGDVFAPLARVTTEFDGLCVSDISAPGDEALDHKYPYTDPAGEALKQLNRMRKNLAQITVELDRISLIVGNEDGTLRSLIDQTAGEIRTEVEDLDRNLRSLIDQTAGEIRAEVNSETAESIMNLLPGRLELTARNLTDGKHASITLSLDGNEFTTGQILIDGNVNVSGQLSAQALYAALGDVANLTVDKLSTSRRIAKYIAQDTGDDNFLRIANESFECVAGIYNGGTAQARDPFGELLYWEQDPETEGVYTGANGMYCLAGLPIYTTTTQTPWPVYVYTYTEQVKAKIAFETERSDSSGTIYTPRITLGAGNKDGKNIGYICKDTDGMCVEYLANTGRYVGMYGTTDGFLDLVGERRLDDVDFSHIENGYFTEKFEGDSRLYTSRITYDGAGRPVSITRADGYVTRIHW